VTVHFASRVATKRTAGDGRRETLRETGALGFFPDTFLPKVYFPGEKRGGQDWERPAGKERKPQTYILRLFWRGTK